MFFIYFELFIHDSISNVPSHFRPFDLSKWQYEGRSRTATKKQFQTSFFQFPI